MNKIISVITFYLLMSASLLMAQPGKSDVRLRRADCFFGVHFDLHASEDITDAGKTLTAEMIDTFLTKVKPDFIQIDCKGHPGISSYPTVVGYHVKSFEKDPLKLFREVTEKRKVSLFMHFSGVWDNKVATEYPYWAIVKSNGERSKEKVSFFSPYLNVFMIPQLKELSDYGVDGAWIDGECWAVEPDYGELSVKRFTEETGINVVPKKPGDEYYFEFMEYTRRLFREHLNKYISAIHQYNPDFQITSNWAYSSIMPEDVKADVDYLSGDVTPQNGVYRSAFEARCLASQGKPWDLMAWGFSWNGADMPMSIKSSVQLQQEAAQIMAMGGGVQFYFQQNRDLSIKPWLATSLSEIGTFCRQRQQFCHKSKAVPQIALLYPTAGYQRNASRPYSNPTEVLQGALDLLLDGQNSVEILMEHRLKGRMNEYPLIVIPECNYIEASFLQELKKYAADGGNLLILGPETAMLFEKELGIKITKEPIESQTFIAAAGKMGAIRSKVASIELMPGTKTTSLFYLSNDFRDEEKNVASSVNNTAQGIVAGVYFDAGSSYIENKSPVIRDFIGNIVADLFPTQIVKVTGSHLVHIAVNNLNEKMYINLINVSGEHTNPKAVAYDEIPPLINLAVQISTDKKPSGIILQPEGRKLKFQFMDGVSKVIVPELPIHSILEIME